MADPVEQTGVSIEDCKVQWVGAEVGGNVVSLRHTGDEATLKCPNTLKSIELHSVQTRREHELSIIGRDVGQRVQVNEQTRTLKTGEITQYGPVAEQRQREEGAKKFYVDDENIIITLRKATTLEGGDAGLNNTSITYTWTITDADNKVIKSGTEGTTTGAKNEITAYTEGHKNDVFTWEIKDSAGNVYAAGVNKQPEGEFPWWMLVAALGIGAVIVIILWLWKSGRLSGHAPMSAPAAPAVSAPAPAGGVVVVK